MKKGDSEQTYLEFLNANFELQINKSGKVIKLKVKDTKLQRDFIHGGLLGVLMNHKDKYKNLKVMDYPYMVNKWLDTKTDSK